MDEATANEIRVLKQENETLKNEVETLKEAVDIVLDTVNAIEDRLLSRNSNEEQEYVPAKSVYDPAVG